MANESDQPLQSEEESSEEVQPKSEAPSSLSFSSQPEVSQSETDSNSDVAQTTLGTKRPALAADGDAKEAKKLKNMEEGLERKGNSLSQQLLSEDDEISISSRIEEWVAMDMIKVDKKKELKEKWKTLEVELSLHAKKLELMLKHYRVVLENFNAAMAKY